MSIPLWYHHSPGQVSQGHGRSPQEQGKDLPTTCTKPAMSFGGPRQRSGVRWSTEASSFTRMLAQTRARSSPPTLRAATTSALVSCWSAHLPHAAASSFPASLLFEDLSPPTTISTEILHPSANSSPTPAPQCRPVASQPGRGRSGLTLPYQEHIWKLASIKTVCAWRPSTKTALSTIFPTK